MADWKDQADKMNDELDTRIRAIPNTKAKYWLTIALAFIAGFAAHGIFTS